MVLRKLLAIGAPILGMVAIVGSGFSAWYFESQTVEAETSMGITLTPIATSYGAFDVIEKDYTLVLDQGGYTNRTDVTKGISVQVGGSNVTSIEASYSIDSGALQILTKDGLTGTITTTVKVLSSLAAYVDFKASGFTKGAASDGYEVYTRETSVATSVDLAIDVTTSSDDLTNAAFAYVNNKKPTDETSYNSLSSLVSSIATGNDPIIVEYLVVFAQQ